MTLTSTYQSLQVKHRTLRIVLAVALSVTSTVAAKPFPSGIIRLFSTDVAKPENSPSWKNVNLDGMRLRSAWEDIQTGPTTYDWSSIDALLDLADQHGKAIGLSVAAGIYAPQWVYDDGAIEYHLKDGSHLSMTIPWDAAFLDNWLRFIHTLGNRYDGNPDLGYVVISGLGQNIETYLSQTAADDAALNALGGTEAWVTAAQQIISAYADAFPKTPFFITASKPLDAVETVTALQQVIDWAVATYPGRFGIMNATLNAKSSTVYYPNLAILTYHDTQPVGFQTLCSSITDPERLQGTLNQALKHGVGLGAHFVEVYQNDADAAKNRKVLATQGSALEKNVPPAGR